MFAKFLHRPALAIVISLIILFLGGLAMKTPPMSQFSSVAPRSVIVAVSYPGASAEVLVDSVLVILEQVIFEPGTDPNVAVLKVNNRIQIVKSRLHS